MSYTPVKSWITPTLKNHQDIYEFPNGYGASVVCGKYTYGGDKGLLELAVLHNGHLCYETPITDDVIGNLTHNQVEELLAKIEALPSRKSEGGEPCSS